MSSSYRLTICRVALLGGALFLSSGLAFADDPPVADTPDFQTLVKQGDRARFSGDYLKAIGAYREALELRDDPTVAGRLGLVLLTLRYSDLAAQQLQHAVDNPTARNVSFVRAISSNAHRPARTIGAPWPTPGQIGPW